jgi:predicted MFS family arabinose efflux permease
MVIVILLLVLHLISFGIGMAIGIIVYRILDAKNHKTRTLILSGITCIASLPTAYLVDFAASCLGIELPLITFMLCFSIIVTAIISVILVQASKKEEYS